MSSVKDFFNFGFIFRCHNLGFSSFIDEPFGFSFCNYTWQHKQTLKSFKTSLQIFTEQNYQVYFSWVLLEIRIKDCFRVAITDIKQKWVSWLSFITLCLARRHLHYIAQCLGWCHVGARKLVHQLHSHCLCTYVLWTFKVGQYFSNLMILYEFVMRNLNVRA